MGRWWRRWGGSGLQVVETVMATKVGRRQRRRCSGKDRGGDVTVCVRARVRVHVHVRMRMCVCACLRARVFFICVVGSHSLNKTGAF